MKKISYTLFLLFILSGVSFAQNKTEAISWMSIEQWQDSMAIKPKKTLLFIHTDWCTYCRKMLKETFTASPVISQLNKSYYAIHLDAESIMEISYRGQRYQNPAKKKTTGVYHPFVLKLLPNQRPIFPTTMILDENITLLIIKQKYLSIKELIKII